MKFSQIPLSVKILCSMAIGLLVGYFNGEVFPGVLSISSAFIMLLQMTALPYIALSLIVGIGSLSVEGATNTLVKSIKAIFILIVITLFIILIAPLSFPDWQNAGFYSANLAETSTQTNFVSLFIPSNPFYAFANGIIPSVVVFSIFFGIGLMTVKHKSQTLSVLEDLQSSIANISNIVMSFAPIGVFCIGVKAAATIKPDELDGMLVYLTTATAVVTLLCFLVIPAVVSIITPFSYRQILKVSREAMITAFATGSFFIVIPTIVEKTKELLLQLEKPKSVEKEVEELPNIIVPITFSLPVGGKLLALLFPLFAAWFSGAYIGKEEYFNLITSGLPQLFGTTTIAMPKLLELFNVTGSMFDFFIVSENLLVGRLSSLLYVMFSASLTLLIAALMAKQVKLNFKRFCRNLAIVPLICIIFFIGLRFGFSEISHQYQGYEKFIDRNMVMSEVNATYVAEPNAIGSTLSPNLDVLTRIKNRGFLRVGYFRDDLPYSFHNKAGKLVGFDIEIFHHLARDLGVTIEFVKIYRDQAAPLLSSGYLDITSGVPLIPDNMTEFTLTQPYSEQAVAIIAKSKRRTEFTNWRTIITDPDMLLGIPETFFYTDAIKRTFKTGEAWEISTPRLFFREKYPEIDGMLFGAAAASAWTLLYPEYTVIVPKPIQPPLAMAFPINNHDLTFELFMRNWLTMKIKDKTIDKLFNYWIAGSLPIETLLNEQNNP